MRIAKDAAKKGHLMLASSTPVTQSDLWRQWRRHAEYSGNTESANACALLQWTQHNLMGAIKALQVNRQWELAVQQHGQWTELHYAYRMMATTLQLWRRPLAP